MRGLIALTLLSCLAACTNKQLYYIGQQWQGSQCSQLADRQDYEACMSRNRGDYESYQKEREQFQNPQ